MENVFFSLLAFVDNPLSKIYWSFKKLTIVFIKNIKKENNRCKNLLIIPFIIWANVNLPKVCSAKYFQNL